VQQCERRRFVALIKLIVLSETDFLVRKRNYFCTKLNGTKAWLGKKPVRPNAPVLRLLKQAFASVSWEITPIEETEHAQF
jgi:hypothetical protein